MEQRAGLGCARTVAIKLPLIEKSNRVQIHKTGPKLDSDCFMAPLMRKEDFLAVSIVVQTYKRVLLVT